jgi:hypothetical protein
MVIFFCIFYKLIEMFFLCDGKDNKPRVGPKRRLGLPRKEQRKKEREAQKRHRIELHDRKVAVRAPLHVVSSADVVCARSDCRTADLISTRLSTRRR